MAKVNGLKVNNITQMIKGVKANPGMAQATFSATTSWKRGLQNQAEVKGFELGGTKLAHSKTFIVESDHPKELLGTDQGPTSVEVVLAALGHCIVGGWAVYGAHLGVPIDDLRVEVEGDIDLQGMLALPEPGKVRPGFRKIRVTHYVKSKAPKEKLEEVKKMAEDLSPTRDSLRAVNFSSKLVIQ
ncbi:MAG: OsmC family protein [Candidatus Levybacteria bacterium]|nr:OsmC family protein [Candidatus Levybacteria bacterium]